MMTNGQNMFDDYDDIFDGVQGEQETSGEPDAYFLEASHEIQKLFKEKPQAVFYMKQLQVKYERKYYHWITRNAIVGLNKLGILKQFNVAINVSGHSFELHFFTPRSNRYPKRQANAIAKIVEEYSQEIWQRIYY